MGEIKGKVISPTFMGKMGESRLDRIEYERGMGGEKGGGRLYATDL